MPRTVLKLSSETAPLPPHEQSILNALVFTALCTEEIFSVLNKTSEEQRKEALREALEWGINHCLVDNEQG